VGHACFFGFALSFGCLFLATGCGGGSAEKTGTVKSDPADDAARYKSMEEQYAKKKK
jgi:hypothetical protein